MTENIEKNCQSCNHQSSGVAVVLDNGIEWKWEDCTKGWGKPPMIGVLKNMCGMYIPKKD